MSRRSSSIGVGRRRAMALAVAGAFALRLPCAAALASEGAEPPRPRRSRLSATKFYTFDPFTLPLIQEGAVTEQFTLVIAVELHEEDQREEIAHLLPRLRDAMYTQLYRMVTFRRAGVPLPQVDDFKVRLYEVARRVAGEEIVAGLLVQQAYKRRAR